MKLFRPPSNTATLYEASLLEFTKNKLKSDCYQPQSASSEASILSSSHDNEQKLWNSITNHAWGKKFSKISWNKYVAFIGITTMMRDNEEGEENLELSPQVACEYPAEQVSICHEGKDEITHIYEPEIPALDLYERHEDTDETTSTYEPKIPEIHVYGSHDRNFTTMNDIDVRRYPSSFSLFRSCSCSDLKKHSKTRHTRRHKRHPRIHLRTHKVSRLYVTGSGRHHKKRKHKRKRSSHLHVVKSSSKHKKMRKHKKRKNKRKSSLESFFRRLKASKSDGAIIKVVKKKSRQQKKLQKNESHKQGSRSKADKKASVVSLKKKSKPFLSKKTKSNTKPSREIIPEKVDMDPLPKNVSDPEQFKSTSTKLSSEITTDNVDMDSLPKNVSDPKQLKSTSTRRTFIVKRIPKNRTQRPPVGRKRSASSYNESGVDTSGSGKLFTKNVSDPKQLETTSTRKMIIVKRIPKNKTKKPPVGRKRSASNYKEFGADTLGPGKGYYYISPYVYGYGYDFGYHYGKHKGNYGHDAHNHYHNRNRDYYDKKPRRYKRSRDSWCSLHSLSSARTSGASILGERRHKSGPKKTRRFWLRRKSSTQNGGGRYRAERSARHTHRRYRPRKRKRHRVVEQKSKKNLGILSRISRMRIPDYEVDEERLGRTERSTYNAIRGERRKRPRGRMLRKYTRTAGAHRGRMYYDIQPRRGRIRRIDLPTFLRDEGGLYRQVRGERVLSTQKLTNRQPRRDETSEISESRSFRIKRRPFRDRRSKVRKRKYRVLSSATSSPSSISLYTSPTTSSSSTTSCSSSSDSSTSISVVLSGSSSSSSSSSSSTTSETSECESSESESESSESESSESESLESDSCHSQEQGSNEPHEQRHNKGYDHHHSSKRRELHSYQLQELRYSSKEPFRSQICCQAFIQEISRNVYVKKTPFDMFAYEARQESTNQSRQRSKPSSASSTSYLNKFFVSTKHVPLPQREKASCPFDRQGSNQNVGQRRKSSNCYPNVPSPVYYRKAQSPAPSIKQSPIYYRKLSLETPEQSLAPAYYPPVNEASPIYPKVDLREQPCQTSGLLNRRIILMKNFPRKCALEVHGCGQYRWPYKTQCGQPVYLPSCGGCQARHNYACGHKPPVHLSCQGNKTGTCGQRTPKPCGSKKSAPYYFHRSNKKTCKHHMKRSHCSDSESSEEICSKHRVRNRSHKCGKKVKKRDSCSSIIKVKKHDPCSSITKVKKHDSCSSMLPQSPCGSEISLINRRGEYKPPERYLKQHCSKESLRSCDSRNRLSEALCEEYKKKRHSRNHCSKHKRKGGKEDRGFKEIFIRKGRRKHDNRWDRSSRHVFNQRIESNTSIASSCNRKHKKRHSREHGRRERSSAHIFNQRVNSKASLVSISSGSCNKKHHKRRSRGSSTSCVSFKDSDESCHSGRRIHISKSRKSHHCNKPPRRGWGRQARSQNHIHVQRLSPRYSNQSFDRHYGHYGHSHKVYTSLETCKYSSMETSLESIPKHSSLPVRKCTSTVEQEKGTNQKRADKLNTQECNQISTYPVESHHRSAGTCSEMSLTPNKKYKYNTVFKKTLKNMFKKQSQKRKYKKMSRRKYLFNKNHPHDCANKSNKPPRKYSCESVSSRACIDSMGRRQRSLEYVANQRKPSKEITACSHKSIRSKRGREKTRKSFNPLIQSKNKNVDACRSTSIHSLERHQRSFLHINDQRIHKRGNNTCPQTHSRSKREKEGPCKSISTQLKNKNLGPCKSTSVDSLVRQGRSLEHVKDQRGHSIEHITSTHTINRSKRRREDECKLSLTQLELNSLTSCRSANAKGIDRHQRNVQPVRNQKQHSSCPHSSSQSKPKKPKLLDGVFRFSPPKKTCSAGSIARHKINQEYIETQRKRYPKENEDICKHLQNRPKQTESESSIKTILKASSNRSCQKSHSHRRECGRSSMDIIARHRRSQEHIEKQRHSWCKQSRHPMKESKTFTHKCSPTKLAVESNLEIKSCSLDSVGRHQRSEEHLENQKKFPLIGLTRSAKSNHAKWNRKQILSTSWKKRKLQPSRYSNELLPTYSRNIKKQRIIRSRLLVDSVPRTSCDRNLFHSGRQERSQEHILDQRIYRMMDGIKHKDGQSCQSVSKSNVVYSYENIKPITSEKCSDVDNDRTKIGSGKVQNCQKGPILIKKGSCWHVHMDRVPAKCCSRYYIEIRPKCEISKGHKCTPRDSTHSSSKVYIEKRYDTTKKCSNTSVTPCSRHDKKEKKEHLLVCDKDSLGRRSKSLSHIEEQRTYSTEKHRTGPLPPPNTPASCSKQSVHSISKQSHEFSNLDKSEGKLKKQGFFRRKKPKPQIQNKKSALFERNGSSRYQRSRDHAESYSKSSSEPKERDNKNENFFIRRKPAPYKQSKRPVRSDSCHSTRSQKDFSMLKEASPLPKESIKKPIQKGDGFFTRRKPKPRLSSANSLIHSNSKRCNSRNHLEKSSSTSMANRFSAYNVCIRNAEVPSAIDYTSYKSGIETNSRKSIPTGIRRSQISLKCIYQASPESCNVTSINQERYFQESARKKKYTKERPATAVENVAKRPEHGDLAHFHSPNKRSHKNKDTAAKSAESSSMLQRLSDNIILARNHTHDFYPEPLETTEMNKIEQTQHKDLPKSKPYKSYRSIPTKERNKKDRYHRFQDPLIIRDGFAKQLPRNFKKSYVQNLFKYSQESLVPSRCTEKDNGDNKNYPESPIELPFYIRKRHPTELSQDSLKTYDDESFVKSYDYSERYCKSKEQSVKDEQANNIPKTVSKNIAKEKRLHKTYLPHKDVDRYEDEKEVESIWLNSPPEKTRKTNNKKRQDIFNFKDYTEPYSKYCVAVKDTAEIEGERHRKGQKHQIKQINRAKTDHLNKTDTLKNISEWEQDRVEPAINRESLSGIASIEGVKGTQRTETSHMATQRAKRQLNKNVNELFKEFEIPEADISNQTTPYNKRQYNGNTVADVITKWQKKKQQYTSRGYKDEFNSQALPSTKASKAALKSSGGHRNNSTSNTSLKQKANLQRLFKTDKNPAAKTDIEDHSVSNKEVVTKVITYPINFRFKPPIVVPHKTYTQVPHLELPISENGYETSDSLESNSSTDLSTRKCRIRRDKHKRYRTHGDSKHSKYSRRYKDSLVSFRPTRPKYRKSVTKSSEDSLESPLVVISRDPKLLTRKSKVWDSSRDLTNGTSESEESIFSVSSGCSDLPIPKGRHTTCPTCNYGSRSYDESDGYYTESGGVIDKLLWDDDFYKSYFDSCADKKFKKSDSIHVRRKTKKDSKIQNYKEIPVTAINSTEDGVQVQIDRETPSTKFKKSNYENEDGRCKLSKSSLIQNYKENSVTTMKIIGDGAKVQTDQPPPSTKPIKLNFQNEGFCLEEPEVTAEKSGCATSACDKCKKDSVCLSTCKQRCYHSCACGQMLKIEIFKNNSRSIIKQPSKLQ